jgi:hypothetical protein
MDCQILTADWVSSNYLAPAVVRVVAPGLGLGLASDVPEVERQCRRVNDAAECVPIVI